MRTRCARMEPSRTRAVSAGRVVPSPPTAPARRLRLRRSLSVRFWDGTLERPDDRGRPGAGVDALVPLLDLAVPVNHHADALRALLGIDVGAVGGADRPVGIAD